MSFLDEGTFVGVGAVKDAIKDPEFKALKSDAKTAALKTLKMGGSVTTEDEEADVGYGKDPKTGKFKSMSSNDAIKHFLAQVKQSVDDEGDEWPTIKEDLAKFIRKAGGAEYKTQFSDFTEKLKKRAIIGQAKKELKKKPPSSDPENPFEPRKFTVGLFKYTVADNGTIKDSAGEVVGNVEDVEKNVKSSLSKELANIHTAPQDEFDVFIKGLGKNGYDRSEIKKIIKKRKEYQAKKASDSAKKKKEKKDTLKEIVKKCLNRGMIKENIFKVVKKYKLSLNENASLDVNVNKEDDYVEVTYKGESYKSALGDELVFIHYFKDGEYHGENDAPEIFKYLKGIGGELLVDDEEATLTINMSNLI